MQAIKDKWNKIYLEKQKEPTPALVLTVNQHLLPNQGRALDLACGLGGNAIALAKLGFLVDAWDISDVAISNLKKYADKNSLVCNAQVRDVIANPPDVNSYDVIIVSYFLFRALSESLVSALKPGGVLYYQTYCVDKVTVEGPSNPDFLLADNELLSLFSSLNVRAYSENALLGDQQQGLRNQAYLVAEKVI